MGWQDRDYHRGYEEGSPQFGGGPSLNLRRFTVVSIVMGVNIAVFVLCTMSGGRDGAGGSPIFKALELFTPAITSGEIWRLITANYLHWDFMHIFFNMLGLFFFGRSLEEDWGRKRFFAVYTISGLLGSVFYLVLTLVGWLPLSGRAAGASGCVLGMIGACAVLFPHARLFIFPLPFPIKVRTFALVFGGWYVVNLIGRGPNAGGDACHLAGLLFGAWWAWRGQRWWGGLPALRRPSFRTRLQRRVPLDPKSPFGATSVDEATLDRILKKVGEYGLHSLSESEKQILLAATEERRRRG